MPAHCEVEPRFSDATGWQQVAPVRQAAVAHTNRICCVVPCYNVADLCGPVVREAARHADWVLAVDDGSSDDTRTVLESVAATEPKVQVLVHVENAGKGAALLTAFRHAVAHCEFDTLVTIDGDGQHRPLDIPRLAAAVRRPGIVLAIGERDAFGSMPLRSRLGNEVTSALLRLIYPHAPKDTQCGLRALSRDFVIQVAQGIKGNRYETELRMLLACLERGLGITGVSIPTVYIAGNRSSHFNPVFDSVRVMYVLLSWWGHHLFRNKHLPESYRAISSNL